MAERLPLLIFLLASHLFVSGVFSMSIIKIENKCNHTVWPVIFSSKSQVSPTGFILKIGEARAVHAPSSWHGIISGRTFCSRDSARNFSCATGDCESGKIECPGSYGWSHVTYVYFRIDFGGINSHTISVKHGYNLPIMVVPSQRSTSPTCFSSGCTVDLNQTCPSNLKKYVEERLIGCSSPCQEFGTPEDCCEYVYSSKQNCRPTLYTQNFGRACPLSHIYAYDDTDRTFTCTNSTDYVLTFCPSITETSRNNNKNLMTPSAESKNNSQRKLKPILGGSAALVVLIIIVAIAVVIVRARNGGRKSEFNNENIDAAVMFKRYSYDEVKKMTCSFDHVLGKGGYGTVYKGKLPDPSGRDIALKVLDESKKNGEDFINELASMSRASHVNIASLFGFCYEGSKRALIYEFMPNGSLDMVLSKNISTKMDWRTLYNIAAGIARGLEYLHNSCVSKIVHFDIKPQNILMDKDFCPKISDFGLAKLCRETDSNISMFDARGTIGYIAPEVFSQSYGGVSHKSDVYSYGMVVLEMIGATNTKRAETSKSNASSIFFPDCIYEDLERNDTMKLVGGRVIEEEEEEKIVKKMALVGLWCIQTHPSDRPPMREVVEMLEGSLEALQFPPKPLLDLHVITGWGTGEGSQETSSFVTSSERRTPCQDTLIFSKEAVQDIARENQDSS